MAIVLIVDDDEVTRLMLGRMLEDAGHEVTYAGDGAAALRVFRVGRFDVVFTDLAMPEKNGFLLIQEIRDRERSLPVIAMSGTNAEQLPMAEDLGASRVLYKPLDPQMVHAVMEGVMSEATRDVWSMAWG